MYENDQDNTIFSAIQPVIFVTTPTHVLTLTPQFQSDKHLQVSFP